MYTKPPCSFWLQGKCTFGDKCKNPHAVPAALTPTMTPATRWPKPQAELGICPYFSKGTCMFGGKCRLAHISPPMQTPTTVPLPKPFGPCKFFAQGNCSRVDCPFSHYEPSPSVREVMTISHPPPTPFVKPPVANKAACRFFQQGRCTRI
ncbi:uncharacterized protein STEHIDRAFT_121003, partial [Stereum hirsutum FP-91666 SS1]|uniref:uncharacterized protein n=1 Tax=Stereum hirsutum (strain FP-91666) TaxID=721885 RepID=UPI000440BA45